MQDWKMEDKIWGKATRWNAVPENGGTNLGSSRKMRDWKMEDNIWGKDRRWKIQDRKMEEQIWGQARRWKMRDWKMQDHGSCDDTALILVS